MANFFDQFDDEQPTEGGGNSPAQPVEQPQPQQGGGNFFDQFDEGPTPEPDVPVEADRSVGEVAGDIGLSLLEGSVMVPEGAVGLADMAVAPFRNRFNEITGIGVESITENLADAGVDFQRSREIITDELKSDGSRQARANINAAFNEGMLSGLGELASNPATIFEGVAASVPMMLTGAGVTRMAAVRIFANAEKAAIAAGASAEGAKQAAQAAVKAAAPKLQAIAAAAEGGQVAGLAGAEYAAEGNLGDRQALGATAQGLSTAAITMALNRLGAKVGLEDVEAALGSGSSSSSMLGRATKGAIREGPLEEGIQSTAETAIGNITDGRPVSEGLGQAYVEGAVTGTPLGAGMGAISKPTPETQVDDDAARKELEALQAEAEQAAIDEERRARGSVADQAASEAAAAVEAAGGDSLDALNAATDAYNATEARLKEQAAAERTIDQLNGVIEPDPVTVDTQELENIERDNDPITEAIVTARAMGDESTAIRLENAQRMRRTADQFEAQGRVEQAANFRARADRIVTEILGPQQPANQLPGTALPQQGEVIPAEQIEATVAQEPPATIDSVAVDVTNPALPSSDTIYVEPTTEQLAARQARDTNNELAMEGIIEPGQEPRPAGNLQDFGTEIPQNIDSEIITDDDYVPASEESELSPAMQAAKSNRELNEILKPLEGEVITEQVQDEDGNIIEVGRPAAPEVRRMQKRLQVMDSLMECLG